MDSVPKAERDVRIDRERKFHDARFSDDHRQAVEKYYTVDTGSAQYAAIVSSLARPGAVVLEYGCGTGSSAFELAAQGATVVGIDISGVGVTRASEAAAAQELGAAFVQMDAERLGFGSEMFDLVCGSSIVHHLDIDGALDEVHRVLRDGGEAVFYEPLGSNPFINLYRRLTPSMRTVDEHPLRRADFSRMQARFAEVSVEYHDFLALTGVVLRQVPVIGERMVAALQMVDAWLFRRIPRAGALAWVAVVRLRK